jgi:hypothetical protein
MLVMVMPDAVDEDESHPQQDGQDRQPPRQEVAVEGPILSFQPTVGNSAHLVPNKTVPDSL